MSADPIAARRPGRKATLARIAAVVVSVAMVSMLIINESRAAFTATTENTGNGFAAATITLTDNDGGSTAMFNVSNMVPGQSVVSCIEVTYTGSVTTNGVKVYRGAYTDSGSFADHLDIQIEEETTGAATAFNDCTGFVGAAVAGLTTIASMPTTYGTGVGTWTPTATASQWYKFTVTLGTDTPNTEQGESVSALPFTWETTAGT